MIPAADLDQLLMSFCTERWQKVAMYRAVSQAGAGAGHSVEAQEAG